MPQYPRFSAGRTRTALTYAHSFPAADPAVVFPDWYLVHAHFLPGGYLSRFGSVLYGTGIRRMYSLFRAGAVERKLARLVARAHPGGSVLDLGCGGGSLLAVMAAEPAQLHLTGLDLSPVLLERARRRVGSPAGVRLVHGRADALPFEDAAFAAITAVHVAGHLPQEALAPLFAEARRTLAPGGRLYLLEHRWHRLPAPGFELVRRRPVSRTPLVLTVLAPAR